jgi:thiol:disulfide interchange protein
MLRAIQAALFAVLLLAGWVGWKIVDASEDSQADASSDWYAGVEQIEDSLIEADLKNRPHLIYLYTDWCGYCKELNAELLDSTEMHEALSDVVKIRINPEDDAESKQMEKELGSRGYPAIFVRDADSDSYRRVRPFVKASGSGWKLVSADAFSAAVHGEL